MSDLPIQDNQHRFPGEVVQNSKNSTEDSAGFNRSIETLIEKSLFGARWLLAPLYLGLAFSLIPLCLKFVERLINVLDALRTSDIHDVTLQILELLDITLLGNLIVIIIFSDYENFVSKIGVAKYAVDRPSWMGKVDYSGLKIKLIGSLVAISVIELLKDFMNPEKLSPEIERWRIGIHLTFVISGVLFALMDFIADKRTVFELDAERKDLEMERLRHEVREFKHQQREISKE